MKYDLVVTPRDHDLIKSLCKLNSRIPRCDETTLSQSGPGQL